MHKSALVAGSIAEPLSNSSTCLNQRQRREKETCWRVERIRDRCLFWLLFAPWFVLEGKGLSYSSPPSKEARTAYRHPSSSGSASWVRIQEFCRHWGKRSEQRSVVVASPRVKMAKNLVWGNSWMLVPVEEKQRHLYFVLWRQIKDLVETNNSTVSGFKEVICGSTTLRPVLMSTLKQLWIQE